MHAEIGHVFLDLGKFVVDAEADEEIMPESTVYMYSGSGLQRLFDIRLSYGGTASGIAAEKTRLAAAVETAAKACADDDGPSAALKVCNYMVSRCVYSKTSDMNTVYYAMMYGTADSEGMALTYKALCSKLGIECRVVKGLMNQEDHWWNIIKLGDDYYHAEHPDKGYRRINVSVKAEGVLPANGQYERIQPTTKKSNAEQ